MQEKTQDLIKPEAPNKAKRFKDARSGHKDDQLGNAVIDAVSSRLQTPKMSAARHSIASLLSLQLKKHKLPRMAAKKFKVSRNLLKKARKHRPGRKAVPDTTVKEVHIFYEENSNTMPDKKLVSKRTGKATSFLYGPIVKLYKKFCKEHPHVKISLAKFFQLRPKNVKPMGKTQVVGCLCEYCEDV